MYVCHKKGPNGRPTYDRAGFQLDWKKVDEWMKPQAFNKSRMVNGMNRVVERMRKEEEMQREAFFVDGKGPKGRCDIPVYTKDHISKDLQVPWHQINAKRISEWQ